MILGNERNSMKDLLKHLEKESDIHINLADGCKISDEKADAMPAFQTVLEHCKANLRDGIHVLEAAEEVASRQVDPRYPNPNDNYMFSLLRILKLLRWKHHDDSSRVYIAERAADKMMNSRHSLAYRKEHILENLYDLSSYSRGAAVDELYDIIPLWKDSHEFDKMNSFLEQIDLSKFNRSLMYSTVHLVCNYINYLPYYPTFWQKVYDEFIKRSTAPDASKEDARTPEQIDDLLNRWKDGPGMHEKYDHTKPRPENKSPEQEHTKKILEKIEWAKAHGDKDLENMLTWYNEMRMKGQEEDRVFRNLQSRYGDKEVNKMAATALRAMADRLENPGAGFMTHCVIPTVPIFGDNKWPDDWFSHIEVSLMRGPIGG